MEEIRADRARFWPRDHAARIRLHATSVRLIPWPWIRCPPNLFSICGQRAGSMRPAWLFSILDVFWATTCAAFVRPSRGLHRSRKLVMIIFLNSKENNSYYTQPTHSPCPACIYCVDWILSGLTSVNQPWPFLTYVDWRLNGNTSSSLHPSTSSSLHLLFLLKNTPTSIKAPYKNLISQSSTGRYPTRKPPFFTIFPPLQTPSKKLPWSVTVVVGVAATLHRPHTHFPANTVHHCNFWAQHFVPLLKGYKTITIFTQEVTKSCQQILSAATPVAGKPFWSMFLGSFQQFII